MAKATREIPAAEIPAEFLNVVASDEPVIVPDESEEFEDALPDEGYPELREELSAEDQAQIDHLVPSTQVDDAPVVEEPLPADQVTQLVDILKEMQGELRATRLIAQSASDRADAAEARLAAQGREIAEARASSLGFAPKVEPQIDRSQFIEKLSDQSEYPVIYYSPNFTDQKLRVYPNGQPARYIAGRMLVEDPVVELAVRKENYRQCADPDRWKGDDLSQARTCRHPGCGFTTRNHWAFEDHLMAKDH